MNLWRTPVSTRPMPTPWVRSTPRTAVAKPTGLTGEFLANPLQFMRTHSMSPPSDSGATFAKEHGTVAKTNFVPGAEFHESVSENLAGTTIERRTGAGGVRQMQVIRHADLNFPGACGLKIATATQMTDRSYVPIYWLPWKSKMILSYKIPAVPHSLAEWDDDEYPRFFFTAGINGCSVFAQGSPEGPTVSHGGIESKIAGSTAEFWRKQMALTKSGWGGEAIRGEVNKQEYMFSGGSAKVLAEEYKTFLGPTGKDNFSMEIVSPFGCVFGIRYGRSWTLYLQKSVVFNKVRFYKADGVKEIASEYRTDMFAKDSGLLAKQEPSVFSKIKIGPLTVRNKEAKVFSTAQRFAMPLEVVEIYPNRKTLGSLKDVFKKV